VERLDAEVYWLTETGSRLRLTVAILAAAAVITLTADWWVIGPGTTFPVNGYRFPLVEFNQEMAFGADANLFALISGWNDPTPTAVWSGENRAELAFRLQGEGPHNDEPTLVLHLLAYLAPPKLTLQRITVWVGTTKLGDAALTTSDSIISLPLKGIPLPRDPAPIMIRLDLPDAISPHDAEGKSDRQPLAVGLVSLKIY
jgi:hypothetical protein